MNTKNRTIIYWSLLKCNEWEMHIAATSKGLCYVGSENSSIDEISAWAEKQKPGSILVENEEKLQPYAKELIEYLERRRTNFTFTLDYMGTPFQLAVWRALCEIPYAQTRVYSDIANMINKPSAVRAVGAAIGANPVLITIPCHRIIGKNGSLTGYRGGLGMKTELLGLEKEDLVRNLEEEPS